MAKRTWEPLLVWTFKGGRFDRDEEDDGLDLRDLDDLVRLRAVLVDLAKEVWWRDHPDRERLSPHAEQAIALRFFHTTPGSRVVPIFYSPVTASQTDLFGLDVDVDALASKMPAAARMFSECMQRIHQDGRVPESLPPATMSRLSEIGTTLGPGEGIEIEIVAQRPALLPDTLPLHDTSTHQVVRFDSVLRERLLAAAHASAEAAITTGTPITVRQTVTGQVTMANIKGKATLHVDGRGDIALEFDAARETEVTGALAERQNSRLRVRGQAEVDARGRIRKIAVEDMRVVAGIEESEEQKLSRLAVDDPDSLLDQLLTGRLPATALTFAAEIAGNTLPPERVVPVLLDLLKHESPLVREGALYGLARHDALPEVAEAVRRLAASDASPGVRAVAEVILEDKA